MLKTKHKVLIVFCMCWLGIHLMFKLYMGIFPYGMQKVGDHLKPGTCVYAPCQCGEDHNGFLRYDTLNNFDPTDYFIVGKADMNGGDTISCECLKITKMTEDFITVKIDCK